MPAHPGRVQGLSFNLLNTLEIAFFDSIDLSDKR